MRIAQGNRQKQTQRNADGAVGDDGSRLGPRILTRRHTREWGVLLQVLYETLDIVEVLAQIVLLLLLRADVLLRLPSAFVAVDGTISPLEYADQLAGTVRVWRAWWHHWGLGHEIEVQELQQLHLDLLGRLLVLEQCCYCEQAVHLLEDACILRCRYQGCDENEEGCGLDGRAVEGVEQIEKQVHFVFAAEYGAGGRVKKEQPLKIRE